MKKIISFLVGSLLVVSAAFAGGDQFGEDVLVTVTSPAANYVVWTNSSGNQAKIKNVKWLFNDTGVYTVKVSQAMVIHDWSTKTNELNTFTILESVVQTNTAAVWLPESDVWVTGTNTLGFTCDGLGAGTNAKVSIQFGRP